MNIRRPSWSLSKRYLKMITRPGGPPPLAVPGGRLLGRFCSPHMELMVPVEERAGEKSQDCGSNSKYDFHCNVLPGDNNPKEHGQACHRRSLPCSYSLRHWSPHEPSGEEVGEGLQELG